MSRHCPGPILLHSREGPADPDSADSGLGAVIRACAAAEGDVPGDVSVGFADEVSYVQSVFSL